MAEQVADEYELPSSAYDAELDAPLPVRGEAPTTPERNEKGQFVKADAPKHSPRLLKLAEVAGFTKEEISGMSSADLKAEVELAMLERQNMRLNSQVHQPVTPSAEPPTPPPPAKEESFDLGLDPEQYDDKLISAFNKLKDHLEAKYEADVKQLREELSQVGGYVKHQVQQTAEQKADAVFSKHAHIFGKGGAKDIGRDSSEFKRRALVWAEALKNTEQIDFDDKLEKAVELIYGKKPVEQATEPSTPQKANGRFTEQDFERATSHRPTHRNGAAEPKGEKRATKAVAEKFRELGVTDDSFTIEEANLPD